MRLFSNNVFLTVLRNREDSSPNTIRPLRSTTRIPSFVRVASVSFIRTLLCGLHQIPPGPDRCRTTVTHQPIGAVPFWQPSLRAYQDLPTLCRTLAWLDLA